MVIILAAELREQIRIPKHLSTGTDKRRFQKTVALTTAVDPDSAKAEYNNGILEVTLRTKNKGVKSKKVNVL